MKLVLIVAGYAELVLLFHEATVSLTASPSVTAVVTASICPATRLGQPVAQGKCAVATTAVSAVIIALTDLRV